MDLSKIKGLLKGTLIRGGLWLTLTTLISQIFAYAALGIFTRILGQSGFGDLSYYIIMLPIFTTVCTLGLTASIQRGKADHAEDFDGFISSILFLATITCFIALVICIPFKKEIASLINLNENLLILLIIHCFFQFALQVNLIKYTTTYEYKKYFMVEVSKTILSIVISLIFIYFMEDNKFYGRVYGIALVSIVYGAIFYIKLIRKGKVFINIDWWKYALVISIPLIFHSLSGVILNYFDGIAIKEFFKQ